MTESDARARGLEVEIVKVPWSISGRARSFDRTDGLTKIIVDAATERILGVGICGHGAGELISEGVLAIEMGAPPRTSPNASIRTPPCPKRSWNAPRPTMAALPILCPDAAKNNGPWIP